MPTNSEVTSLLYELKEAKFTVTSRATDEHINLVKYMYGKNLLGKTANSTYRLSDNGQYIIDKSLTYETWLMLSNTKDQWVDQIVKTLIKEEKSQFSNLKNHNISEFDRGFEEALIKGIIKRNGNGYDYQLTDLGYTIHSAFLNYAEWRRKDDARAALMTNSNKTTELITGDSTLQSSIVYDINDFHVHKRPAKSIYAAVSWLMGLMLFIIAGVIVWYFTAKPQ